MPSPPADHYALVGKRIGFRLAYITPALRRVRETSAIYRLNDKPVKIRYNSCTIHDVINDTPNTCGLTIDAATPPTSGQRLTVRINANRPRTLFAGPLQTVGLTYEGRGLDNHTVYPCQAIDDTPLANRKLPYGAWTNVSASQIATYLVVTFCPAGFSDAGVQPNLPAVSVNFDATEGMDGCLRQLAKLIGGYFYWEDRVLHLFITEASDTPDPIDLDHPFLNDPPIAVSTDTSQVRTRVYGKGYAEEVIGDVAANDSIIPISNAVMFNPNGGQAVSETQRLRYTGTTPGGGGSLVGPGIGPAAAPSLALLDGAGVTPGLHYYAVTFQTAAGESLISPYPSINVGPRPDPTITPAFGAPTFLASGGVEPGGHLYAVADLTASGETRPGPPATFTVRNLTDPTIAPVWNNTQQGAGASPYGPWQAGAQVQFQYSYTSDPNSFAHETNLSPASAAVTLKQYVGLPAGWYMPPNIVVPPSSDPAAKWINLWGFVPGQQFVAVWCGSAQNIYPGNSPTIGASAAGNPFINYPGANPILRQVAVSVPAATDPVVTSRKLYRTIAGGSQLKLLAAIGIGLVSYTDTTPDANLGANALSTPTAASSRVAMTGIPIGASTVIGRKIYRTAADAGQLKFLATLADNTTTTYLDALADAALGANAPTADTSGLKQPDGVVLAGASSLVVAGASWARVLGGYAVIGNGTQVIRYTGISGNSLTGIPPAGPGAITATVSYGSTITAAAALLGVTGLLRALIKGAPINLWVQRDDTNAQAQLTALDGTDGVIEHLITDERRGEASLIQLCDADLKQYSQPIRTVPYATRDVKTKSGKPITFNLGSPQIVGTLTIQDVTISEIDVAPGLPPKFTATASTVRFSIDDILRRLGAALDVTT